MQLLSLYAADSSATWQVVLDMQFCNVMLGDCRIAL